MSFVRRLGIFVTGLTLWLMVLVTGMAHAPMWDTLGPLHAGIAAATAALAFLPRGSVRWLR